MKGCELCSRPATTFCDSDHASLCWDCDEKVHSANFLVAKHTRCLLCRVCQSSMPWRATGPKLRPIVSVCETCVIDGGEDRKIGVEREEQSRGGGDQFREDRDEAENEYDSTDDDGEYEESDEEEDEDEDGDGDNQVVPWSSSSSPFALASSFYSSETESVCRVSGDGGGGVSSLKRVLENSDFESEDENSVSPGSASYHGGTTVEEDDGDLSLKSDRPLKFRRTTQMIWPERSEAPSTSETRFQPSMASR